MAKKKRRNSKAPSVSGLTKDSKNASNKANTKLEISRFNENNELIKSQLDCEYKNFMDENERMQRDFNARIKDMEIQLEDTLGALQRLSETQTNLEKSNVVLKEKMTEQKIQNDYELKSLNKKHQEKLNFLTVKLSELELTQKQLHNKHTTLKDEDKKSKLEIIGLSQQLKQCKKTNQRYEIDIHVCKEKLIVCIKELKEAETENSKKKDEIEALKLAVNHGELVLERLNEEKNKSVNELGLLENSLVEMNKKLSDEKVQVNTMKNKLVEMVDNQRKKEQDVRNLIAALKKVHKKNEETDLEVKKVMNKLESQGMVISTQEKENKKIEIENKRLQNDKSEVLNELLAVRQQLAKVKKAGFFRRLFKKY